MALFADLETSLTENVGQASVEAMSNVAATVSGPFQSAVIVNAILCGILIIAGRIQEPVMDVFWKIIKLGILSALIVGAAYVDQVARELGEMLSVVGLGSAGSFFDEMVTALIDGEEETSPGTFEIGLALARVGVFIIVATAFLVFVAQKLILLLLVAIAPIFVALSLFEPTRRFFHGWLTEFIRTLLTLALIQTMSSAGLGARRLYQGLRGGR